MDFDSDVCNGPFGFGTTDGDTGESSIPLFGAPEPHDHDHDADSLQYVDGPSYGHAPS